MDNPGLWTLAPWKVFHDRYRFSADFSGISVAIMGLWGRLAGDALAGAQVVVAMRERTRFDRALLSALPDLRLLVTTGPFNAAIDLAAADEQGVTVCGTAGPASANTAELTWGLIQSVLRNIPAEAAGLAAGGWQHTVGRDLLGARLGLVGLGRIGHQMARIAAAFEMDVVAWSQHLDPEVAAAAGVPPRGGRSALPPGRPATRWA